MRLKHPIKRGIAIVAAAGIIASGAAPAFADAYGIALYGTYYVDQGNVTVEKTSEGTKVTYTENEQEKSTIDPDEIIITNKDVSKSTDNTVSIKDSNVTISNVNIDASKTDKAAISASGNVSIELDGKNTVSGGWGHAGVEKTDVGSLTIKDDNDEKGSLSAKGGSQGAGIGGSTGESTSNITITGGTITANGGNMAAGIGGGKNGGAKDITISGSDTTVDAAGGANGAGIGGGLKGNADGITIKDGADVTAKGGLTKDPDGDIGGGAGIGGGAEGDGLGIKIDGSTVKGTGTTGGSGIGGGVYGAGDVTITGGSHVEGTATAEGGAGIGGDGLDMDTGTGKTSTVKIDNSTVIGTGSSNSAGIGGGNMGGANVTITGKDSDVTGVSDKGAGIGGSGTVTIEDGKVTGIGGVQGAGIGSSVGQKDDVTIKGGTVSGTGGSNAAGIGSGRGGSSDVKITGGEVTGNGGYLGAGIGSGRQGASDTTISGGTVTAKGNESGAGIGGGYKSTESTVTISGGEIKAEGGEYASGIGGGESSAKDDVSLKGGTITAVGGNGGAGIGNGYNGKDTTVTINADKADLDVTATVKGQPKGAIGSWGADNDSITAGALGEAHKAILKFMNDSGLYKTVHNAAYVGTGETHAWDEGVVLKEATCTENGKVLYTCTIDKCGETEERVIPATGHNWGAWTVTKPAAESKAGVETRTCSNCGDTETRGIPAWNNENSAPRLRVLDKENVDRYFEMDQQGDTLTVTSEYETVTTLTGSGKAISELVEQGVKTLVFVTPQGTAKVDAAALAAMLGDDGVFRLVVTESSMDLWVNGVLHNELLK